MVKDTVEFIILLVQVGILSVILGFFIYRRVKLKIRSINWFIWIFSLAILQAVYELIFWGLINNGYTIFETYNDSHFIIYGLALLVLFFFLENLEHNSPRFWSSSIAISLWVLFITTYLYDMIFGVQSGAFEEHLGSYFFDLLQLFIMFYAAMAFFRIFRKAKHPRLRLISSLFFIAFVVLAIVSILELTEHWIDYQIPNVYFFTAVFFYLALTYLIFPYYVYLAPYDIYNLIILNQNGLVIYNCRLASDEDEKSNALLLGGAVSGLENFLKSFFGTENRLKEITMEDKSLIMSSVSNISVMAIVEKPSFILKNAMSQLLNEILNELPELDQQTSTIYLDDHKTQAINKIIARVFPFIQSDDVFPIEIHPPAEEKPAVSEVTDAYE